MSSSFPTEKRFARYFTGKPCPVQMVEQGEVLELLWYVETNQFVLDRRDDRGERRDVEHHRHRPELRVERQRNAPDLHELVDRRASGHIEPVLADSGVERSFDDDRIRSGSRIASSCAPISSPSSTDAADSILSASYSRTPM